jgi:hypothetical protein
MLDLTRDELHIEAAVIAPGGTEMQSDPRVDKAAATDRSTEE